MLWLQNQAGSFADRARRERQEAFCAQMNPEKVQIPQALGRRPTGMPLAKGAQLHLDDSRSNLAPVWR
jgi:hypothetical protein